MLPEDELRPKMKELESEVVEKLGLMTVPMAVLRKRCGVKKLGRLVVGQMGKALRSVGLRYLPDPLPRSQDKKVRLCREGTQAARLIEAALIPSTHYDEILRRAVEGSDAESLLRKIASDVDTYLDNVTE